MIAPLPETLQEALDDLGALSAEELYDPRILSKTLAKAVAEIPKGNRVHGVALVLVTADHDAGDLRVSNSIDVYSQDGLDWLVQETERVLERLAAAHLLTTPVADG